MSLFEHCIIPDWPAPPSVKALQTTRSGGYSKPPYDSLNLGTHVGDNPLAVNRNRMLLAPLMPSEPVWMNQVHGVHVVDAGQAGCVPQLMRDFVNAGSPKAIDTACLKDIQPFPFFFSPVGPGL